MLQVYQDQFQIEDITKRSSCRVYYDAVKPDIWQIQLVFVGYQSLKVV